jgi:hypothetical protein
MSPIRNTAFPQFYKLAAHDNENCSGTGSVCGGILNIVGYIIPVSISGFFATGFEKCG